MDSDKNIYLRLVGGLGNQLYQFSYALFILDRFGYDKVVIDYTSMNNYNENWGFMLYDVLDSNKLKNIVKFDKCLVHKFRLSRLGAGFPLLVNNLGFYADKNLECIVDNKLKNNLYLDGYFESFSKRNSYFDLLYKYLRNDLKVAIDNSVVILNVRGGEYAKLGYSKPSDKFHYKREVSRVIREDSNAIFHLVTDDTDYALNLLGKDIPISKIYEPDPFLNFRTIYSANKKILSNSTFAKWAGYLSSSFSSSIYISEF